MTNTYTSVTKRPWLFPCQHKDCILFCYFIHLQLSLLFLLILHIRMRFLLLFQSVRLIFWFFILQIGSLWCISIVRRKRCLSHRLALPQSGMRELSHATERLESEKSALRTEMLQQASCLNNGDIGDGDEASASLYKWANTNQIFNCWACIDAFIICWNY